MTDISRRLFSTGAAATLITAPAIVRAASLMPVRALVAEPWRDLFAMMKDSENFWLLYGNLENYAEGYYDDQKFISRTSWRILDYGLINHGARLND